MRVLVGVAVFAVILGAGVMLLRMLANPPPREDERSLEDVSEEELTYACSVCGTVVRMLKKPEGEVKPPRHCGEEMELREETG